MQASAGRHESDVPLSYCQVTLRGRPTWAGTDDEFCAHPALALALVSQLLEARLGCTFRFFSPIRLCFDVVALEVIRVGGLGSDEVFPFFPLMRGLKNAGSVATVTRCPARHEGRNSCPATTQSQTYCMRTQGKAMCRCKDRS